MTFEMTVLVVLISIWVVPPLVIVFYMRVLAVRRLFYGIGRGLRGAVDEIGYSVRTYIVTPIWITFSSDAKNRRMVMIKRDTIKVQLMELQQALDFAELKAGRLREQLNGPETTVARTTKKSIRIAEQQRRKGKRKKKAKSRQTESGSASHPAPLRESGDIEKLLAEEEQKILELTDKIAELRAQTDQLDNNSILLAAKSKLEECEDNVLAKDFSRPLECIDRIESNVNEKILLMRIAEGAYDEVRRERDYSVANTISPEKFRELVEKEKDKILQSQTKLPSQDELRRVEELTISVKRAFDFRRKINDFVGKIDPSSERAFQRLRVQFSEAMEAQEVSKSYEVKLHSDLVAMLSKVAELSIKISNAEIGESVSSESTRTTLEASIIDLEAALNNQRRKNRANDDRLFEIASVIERLYLIRSMLSILPVSLRDEFNSLTKLVDAVCVYLTGASSQGAIAHFEKRVSELERDTIMTFIKIAKGETQHLKNRDLTRFTQRLRSASVDLKTERDELQSHRERWDSKLSETDENHPELHALLKYRRDHYASLVKTVDHNIEIVSILVEKQPVSGN